MGARVGIKVFRKEFHTHIHLNYVRVNFLFCKKYKKYKINKKKEIKIQNTKKYIILQQ